jgi:imidazolonepropionase
MRVILQNIAELVQVEDRVRPWVAGREMSELKTIKNAFLYIREELIEDFGPMQDLTRLNFETDDLVMEIDCAGKLVFPCYCDSHTHLVFPKTREQEFVDRIRGLSYEEISKNGGGILNSAHHLQEMSEDELYTRALERIEDIIATGTGAVEIKSGYGLTPESELKMLRVIDRLKKVCPIMIKSTFLGAHAVPAEYKNNRQEYINILIHEMLPLIATEELADYIDVFCDKGFFTPEETEQILMAGIKYGLRAKVHANELDYSGGIQAGVKYNALSVDHLEHICDEEINSLLSGETMPTILPGAAFFLKMRPAPARKLIDAGLPVALASDFNPGSSPTGNMNLMLSLACLQNGMLPEEAINAATINSAYAMGISESYGSIARGKVANVFITKNLDNYQQVPYFFGTNPVESIILNGQLITDLAL